MLVVRRHGVLLRVSWGVVYIILVVVSSITKKSNTDEKGSDAVTNEVTEEKGIGKVKSTVEQV